MERKVAVTKHIVKNKERKEKLRVVSVIMRLTLRNCVTKLCITRAKRNNIFITRSVILVKYFSITVYVINLIELSVKITQIITQLCMRNNINITNFIIKNNTLMSNCVMIFLFFSDWINITVGKSQQKSHWKETK